MRRFTYRRQIRVSGSDLQAAVAGKKTCTIRAGVVDVEGRDVFLTDGRTRAKIHVTDIDQSKTLASLGDREVFGEGFAKRAELEADLKRYYRKLGPDDPLTVIWFELIAPT